MEDSHIEYSFSPYFTTQEDLIKSLVKFIRVFKKFINLEPSFTTIFGKQKKRKITGWEDPIFSRYTYVNHHIKTLNKEFEIIIHYMDDLENGLIIGIIFSSDYFDKILSDVEKIEFHKDLISVFNGLHISTVNLERLDYNIVHNLYEDFDFTGRKSSFTGFKWLTYLGEKEMQLNGGQKLYSIPSLKCSHPHRDGIYIQTSNSPYDILNDDGKKQYLTATSSWNDIVIQ